MATKEQTRANKENAQRSTGPRTAAGKAQSSKNALKHGLRAQATVLPDENLDEFELLVSELEDQFQPQSAIEWTLLRQLADAEWRMRRVPCIEAALLAAKLNETMGYYRNYPDKLPKDDAEADMVLLGDAAESDACNGDTFSKLSRYEARLSHRYFKALEQLQKLQSQRQRAADPESHSPAAHAPTGGTNGAEVAGGDQVLKAQPSEFISRAPAHNLVIVALARNPTPPQPISSSAPIAEGDPSPARKGRVQTGTHPPEQRQPPSPAPQAAPVNTQPAPKPTANQKDRALSRPQRRTRPQCAKRTQFPPKASTKKFGPLGSKEADCAFPGRAVPQPDTRILRRRVFLGPRP